MGEIRRRTIYVPFLGNNSAYVLLHITTSNGQECVHFRLLANFIYCLRTYNGSRSVLNHDEFKQQIRTRKVVCGCEVKDWKITHLFYVDIIPQLDCPFLLEGKIINCFNGRVR